MKPTLIILAAGMGSRYGGMKQLDRLGPSGETIMEYSIYDALKAGFGKVVFVIRGFFAKEFQSLILPPLKKHMDIALAYQELDALPRGCAPVAKREKPWGTGHALWVTREVVDGPFAVINADDFYGRPAFVAMARFLESLDPNSAGLYAACGYRLGKTLSEHGKVARGVCQVNSQGYLESVTEQTAIARVSSRHIISGEGSQALILDEDSIVSMNFWGFSTDIYAPLEEQFHAFYREEAQNPKSEFYIPFVVDELIRHGLARVRVLDPEAEWFGVTYRLDKENAMKKIHRMVREGIYPNKLWAG